jgi:hypothetical protein
MFHKQKKYLILGSFALLLLLIGLIKVTIKIEGEIYLSCEDTKVTFPFKHSVSTRIMEVPFAKKEGVMRAESLMISLEKMLDGATADYEIKKVELIK